MLLRRVTGVTDISDQPILQSFSHLIIVKTGAAAIIDEKITVSLKTGGSGSVSVCNRSKIKRLAAITQYEGGYQLIDKLGDGTFKSAFRIAFSNVAAIELQDDTTVSIDLSGLVIGSTYEIYALGAANAERQYIKYTSDSIPAAADGAQKSFTADNRLLGLAIANDGALSSIRLVYGYNSEVTYLPEELDALMRINDTSFAPDTFIEGDSINQTVNGGGADVWYINMKDVQRYEIITAPAAELSLVRLNGVTF
jgi:hypothetical protein